MSPTKDTMNCKDYNEALLTDPGFEDESGHLESCASCQALAAEVSALEGKIKSAMEIDVPELRMPELPDIETDNVVSIAARRSWAKPAWFALAATVVLAAFIGVRMTGMNNTYGSLEEQVLAHIDHEPGALPWADWNNPWASPISAQDAIPIPPTRPPPKSERMSPNMFSITSTSNSQGLWIRSRAWAST